MFVEELTDADFVKIFQGNYKTRLFIAVFTSLNTGSYPEPHVSFSHTHSVKLHFNIVLTQYMGFINSILICFFPKITLNCAFLITVTHAIYLFGLTILA